MLGTTCMGGEATRGARHNLRQRPGHAWRNVHTVNVLGDCPSFYVGLSCHRVSALGATGSAAKDEPQLARNLCRNVTGAKIQFTRSCSTHQAESRES